MHGAQRARCNVRPAHGAVREHQEIPPMAGEMTQFEDLSANVKNLHTSQRKWHESAVYTKWESETELLEKFKDR